MIINYLIRPNLKIFNPSAVYRDSLLETQNRKNGSGSNLLDLYGG